MIRFVDDFLNGITQYRLMLYFLVCLVLIATFLSLAGFLPFSPVALFFSAVFLTAVCWVTNTIFARVFKAPTNLESVYITALILTLIITPAIHSYSAVISLGWVAILAMAGKYILAIREKHIFNPAALAVFLTALTLNYSASTDSIGVSWWVGTAWMAPFVVIGGLLTIRKIRRFDMVSAFFATVLGVILLSTVSKDVIPAQAGIQLTDIVKWIPAFAGMTKVILDTPVLFFAFVMLTEPLTTPPNKKLQIIYGSLVGILFAPFVHIGSFYFTPEAALLAGNIFSYLVNPQERLWLKFLSRKKVARDTYDYTFERSSNNVIGKEFTFLPGQYMEWTYVHKNPDSRGCRRYFTIASSPTEGNLRIGLKFYPNSSSFKKALLFLNPGNEIVASQLAGEFTLPKDPGKKLCFIAGGIGVTPFRSIIKYLLDTNQKRDIVLLYSNKTEADIVYKDVFNAASYNLGIKTVYVVTDKAGYVNEAMIKTNVPDFADRIFYISGPHSMVDSFENILKEMGLPGNRIKVDFFTGYA